MPRTEEEDAREELGDGHVRHDHGAAESRQTGDARSSRSSRAGSDPLQGESRNREGGSSEKVQKRRPRHPGRRRDDVSGDGHPVDQRRHAVGRPHRQAFTGPGEVRVFEVTCSVRGSAVSGGQGQPRQDTLVLLLAGHRA